MNRSAVFNALVDESHDVCAELVRAFRATLLRCEAKQPISRERGFRLIEGRARYAEKCRRFGLRCAADADVAQRLVLELDQVTLAPKKSPD